jgi:CPA1 family monovalent cation:H+ antiporter
VLTLPLSLPGGQPFPGRALAIALAAGVIVLSLVLATLVLPHTLKGLDLPTKATNRNEENKARSAATEAAVQAVLRLAESLPASDPHKPRYSQAAARIAERYRQRLAQHHDEDAAVLAPGTLDAIERQLRLAGLRAERDELLASARAHGVKDIVLRKLVREVDLQEARYSG